MLFGKKEPTSAIGPPHADPFLAVAHLDAKAEARPDASGHLQIRRPLPERPGLSEFLARALGFRRAVRVNLDERGTFFWRQLDGKRSLGDIETLVRGRYELTTEDSRAATLVYTKALLLRHLIHLELPGMSNEEPTDG